MKTSKWFALLLAAGFATGGLFILNARAADTLLPEGRGALRGRLLEQVKQKLGLTADQSAQIKTVFKADKDTLIGLLSRLHEAHTGLRAAIQASGATEASVRSASARVAAVEAELAVERLRLYGQISPILTSAQVEKVKEMQARRDDFVDIVIGRIGDWLAE